MSLKSLSSIESNGPKRIKIGFLVGKTNPIDRTPPDYQPADLPERYQVHGPEPAPWSQENDKDSHDAKFCVDACVGHKIQKEHGDEFEVDLIRMDEISADRLKQNDVNFIIGIDLVTAWACAHPIAGWDVLGDVKITEEEYYTIKDALSNPECNLLPAPELQDWVYRKDVYMAECQKAGVPILDTIFVDVAEPDTPALIKEVQSRGWRKFVVKPFPSSWSVGFVAFEVEKVVADPKLMNDHFDEYKSRYERYLMQEFIETPEGTGDPFYEIRFYWVNGECMTSISTHFKVASQNSDDWNNDTYVPTLAQCYRDPSSNPLLERAKAIARQAMEVAQRHSTFQGKPTTLSLLRTDIGVTSMRAAGLEHKDGFALFLNEFESLQADWHTRVVLGDPSAVGGVVFEGLPGFAGHPINMLDRMSEFFVKKARQLIRDGGKGDLELSFFPSKGNGARSRSRTPRRTGCGSEETPKP